MALVTLTKGQKMVLEGAVRDIASEDAGADVRRVVRDKLRVSVLAALDLMAIAIGRAQVELGKPHPNAVAVQAGMKAGVAALQGTGVLQQFVTVDSQALDAGALAGLIDRAEVIRATLAMRAQELATQVPTPAELAAPFDQHGGALALEEEIEGVGTSEDDASAGPQARGRSDERVGEEPTAGRRTSVGSPHLTEPKSGFPPNQLRER